ncbi:hypothetical protein [Aliarcobacter butzleri]|uniref:hypothetical protein n=1 Tax=Aliarcobacter butzleri TaxID=28197 RepID=UPI0021B3026A|nr:hypothetical protein [Aliarcobacter butzleri]MCT7572300.1 hypothetical protein [Aliarcobacter butzleri]
MNKDTEAVYKILQDIFKNIWEQQKYSELKNGVLLTFNVALIVIIARLYNSCNYSLNNLGKWMIFILIILTIGHFYFILRSFFPKDSNKEEFKWDIGTPNIFFFGDIEKFKSEKYLDLVIKDFSTGEIEEFNSSKIEKDILLKLSNQIVKLSEITQFKYSSFKNSVYRMYSLSLLYFIFFCILFFDPKFILN